MKNGTIECIEADECIFCKRNHNILDKLAHYEDLEEQGRLIELPCKVGSNVYAIGMNGEIVAFTVDTIGYALSIASQVGKGFYLTKAEAEQKLAELKGGGGDD